MVLGLVGKKLDMTEINDAQDRVAVTVIQAGPCVVLQKRSQEKDGYAAIALGFGEKKSKNTSKASLKKFEKIKTQPQAFICEFRVPADQLDKYQEGQVLKISEILKVGQTVDVSGTTKGRGFAGVFKKHNAGGQSRTHGTHEHFRHIGSIGMRAFPGFVRKNTRMPGHYGTDRVTVTNLKVLRILDDQNCVVVSGSVPGAKNGFLEIHPKTVS